MGNVSLILFNGKSIANLDAGSMGNDKRLTMAKDTSERPLPKKLAHFEVVRRLGIGGMAEVFLAKKRGAENTYKLLVLKRVLPNFVTSSRFRSMFAEEANLATRLNHPNIVQVYGFEDYGEEGQLLSMEFVEGIDLGKLMSAARRKNVRIPPWVCSYVIAEAAKGLHYAHERKDETGHPLDIVHRDVSPQNILLSYEGTVKIADFGVAAANLFRDEVGVLKGKYGYMSPEQARGERVDRRSDIYALGVILYEMLTGRPLHPGLSGNDLLAAVRSGIVAPPSSHAPNMPPSLENITMQALAARKEERFASGRELASALSRAMLAAQVLCDANDLEQVEQQLIGDHKTDGGTPILTAEGSLKLESVSEQHTVAAARHQHSSVSDVEDHVTPTSDLLGHGSTHQNIAREVRHVAIVTIRLHGLTTLLEKANVKRVKQDIEDMFEQLAFKRGAKFTWVSQDQCSAVLGLMANPARATAEAAKLTVDIHDFITSAADDWPTKIEASISVVRGIASGYRDNQGHLIDHDVQQPARFLADLLIQHTPPGATWAAGGIFRLMRHEFVWEDAPSLNIDQSQAFPVPRVMRLHALIRPKSREEREAARAGRVSDLVGRSTELADLHSALHSAQQPRVEGASGKLVARAVIGEMGSGKSALVTAFEREVAPNVQSIHIDLSPARSEILLSSVAEVARGFTNVSSDMSFDQVKQRIWEMLGPEDQSLLPVVLRLAELVSDKHEGNYEAEDADELRKWLLHGMRLLIGSKTKQGPMMLVLDGLQWADEESLNVLRSLLDRSEPVPLLVLVLTRPETNVLRHIESLVRIELRGLRAEEMIRLVASRLGVVKGVSEACADMVPKVAGNPFFLLEMVDALLERGALEIQQVDGVPTLVRVGKLSGKTAPLPSTLEQLIADRIQELPPEEREVVQWLAVAGEPLHEPDLVKLGKLTGNEPVARLCARGMCDRLGDDMVYFRHPITREVAYRNIDDNDRVMLHRRVGEHLASSQIDVGMAAINIAKHLQKGRLLQQAAEYFIQGAQAARRSYQTSEAIRNFLKASQILPQDSTRQLDVHEALESIYRLLGRHRERRRHLELLRKLATRSRTPQWIAVALFRTAVFYYDESNYAETCTFAQGAVDAARKAKLMQVQVEALSILGEAKRELGDIQGALATCDEALDLAKSPKVAPRVRAEVLRSQGLLLRRVGRVREALDCHAEAIAVFRHVGAKRPEARAMNALAFAMFVLERFEESISLASASIQIDLSIGGRFQLAKTLSNIGQAFARLGDYQTGLSYLDQARMVHERYGDQDSKADTLIAHAEVLLETGQTTQADDACGDASALNSVTDNAYDIVHENIVRAEVQLATGDAYRAIALASSARRAAESQALMSFYCLATAVEASARVMAGESHTGILLATTAMGSVSAVQGSEYGLETLFMCWKALRMADSPQAQQALNLTSRRIQHILNYTQNPSLRNLFMSRPQVKEALAASPNAHSAASSAPPT